MFVTAINEDEPINYIDDDQYNYEDNNQHINDNLIKSNSNSEGIIKLKTDEIKMDTLQHSKCFTNLNKVKVINESQKLKNQYSEDSKTSQRLSLESYNISQKISFNDLFGIDILQESGSEKEKVWVSQSKYHVLSMVPRNNFNDIKKLIVRNLLCNAEKFILPGF